MLDLDPTIGRTAFPFQPQASQPHPEPFVEIAELVYARAKVRPEVAGHSANYGVELPDFLGVQVVIADGQFPNPVLKFLHRLSTHLHPIARHLKAKKGEAFSERRDVRLFGAERQIELFQEPLDRLACLFRLVFCPAEHDEVIGVPHEAIPHLLQSPIELVQHDVGEQGTDDSALRCADRRGFEDPVVHHAGCQKLFDESQDVPVGDFLGHSVYDQSVRNVVEKASDIRVQSDAKSRLVK